MVLIFVVSFLGIFIVTALLVYAFTSGAAQNEKQVIATLDSALATESKQVREQVLNLRKSDTLSGIPWLNQRLLKAELGPSLQNLLHQAEVNWTVGGLLAMTGAGFVIPAVLIDWRFSNIILAFVAGLAIGSIPFVIVFVKRSIRFNKFQTDLPEALDMMVSALRAGHSLIAAMGVIARECANPIGSEFRTTFEEQNFGLELKTALQNLTHRVPLQDLRIVSTAIMIQKESGGNLAEVLDKTAHVIRERFRLRREVSTRTAQGRLTGIILTLLPVILGFALYTINPDMMSILWHREIGIKLMWTAGIMIVIGGLIIRKIVNMEV